MLRQTSRANREQQVKVVIRLKPPEIESRYSRCVYLSEQDSNQLVVETDNKKEIFVFDHVAHEYISQVEIYRMIGEESVQHSLEGFNCCIFAYGQTGAGKTYSVLGNIADLSTDLYSEDRGILPRLLQDLFETLESQQGQKHTVTCSYLEIYNEQVFDLLSSDDRTLQIRQDFKKGVFVDGLIENKINSYQNSIELLLEGQKTRKIAVTSMNTESSRSHAIFTIQIESQIIEQQIVKTRKSKINIVDLAGSQRVKHTNVQGERLRQGCNINKSLHVLGNVINSLVQSAKKKKHIPFRDSKLTHYLKDSLGGNSITKLLANVHCSKQYYGDTISTLMFAKRAKSLKMKVEVNQNATQNFDSLRKQVRRLRQELAQARYFKNDTSISERPSFNTDLELTFERITQNTEIEQFPSKNQPILQVFEENQLHYKTLIQIYEEHMKTCMSSSNISRKKDINIVNQWKKLQKRNISLTNLVRKIPAFTKIYHQNILLKQQRNKSFQQPTCDQQKVKRKSINEVKIDDLMEQNAQTQQVVHFYENLLSEVQQEFAAGLENLQKSYSDLQNQCKVKDNIIRQLKKKKQYSPDLEQLQNQNQYLHLNILNLEDQIKKLQQNQTKFKIQIKQSKRNTAKKIESKTEIEGEEIPDISDILDKIKQIKQAAEKQSQNYDTQRDELECMVQELHHQINFMASENQELKRKYNRSKSRLHRSRQKQEVLTNTKSETKKSMIFLSNEDISINLRQSSQTEIKNIHQNYSKEIIHLKMQLKTKQKQVVDLRKELDTFINGDKKIEEEFGKSINQIIQDYRSNFKKNLLAQSKSLKNLQKWKEQDPTSNIKSEYQMQQQPKKRNPMKTSVIVKKESINSGKKYNNYLSPK